MPGVNLIYYTGKFNGDPMFAARLLAFTKNTRLNMTPDAFTTFMAKPVEEIAKEMEYMATTIPSSWEFVDAIFLFTNVRRSTAQQVTRTRTASFAMQSQRVNDMSGVTWDEPATEDAILINGLNTGMRMAINSYSDLVQLGLSLEEAREVLPVGTHCNLVAKYNLRTLVELCQKRQSLRVQGPFNEIVRKMQENILGVWPWAEPFFRPKQEASIALIEQVAKDLAHLEGVNGAMYKGLCGKLAKAADLLKGQ
jgi:thymidylate synthase ThyX